MGTALLAEAAGKLEPTDWVGAAAFVTAAVGGSRVDLRVAPAETLEAPASWFLGATTG